MVRVPEPGQGLDWPEEKKALWRKQGKLIGGLSSMIMNSHRADTERKNVAPQ